MATSNSNKLRILEINNNLKKIEAYVNDEPVLKCSSEVVYKGREEIKALLNEIKFYTEEKIDLENDFKQGKCNKKQIQDLDKIIDEDKKRQSELQILYQQEEKKKIELVIKYGVMMQEKSQRLRDSHKYFKKEYYVKELAMIKEKCEELLKKKTQALNVIDELQRESNEMSPSVPYDTFNSIMGIEANDELLKEKNPHKNKTSKK